MAHYICRFTIGNREINQTHCFGVLYINDVVVIAGSLILVDLER